MCLLFLSIIFLLDSAIVKAIRSMDKSHIYDISGLSDEQVVSLVRQIVSSHPGCGAVRIIKAKAN